MTDHVKAGRLYRFRDDDWTEDLPTLCEVMPFFLESLNECSASGLMVDTTFFAAKNRDDDPLGQVGHIGFRVVEEFIVPEK